MAAGLIPVVYQGGGLPEIVGEKEGYVWKTQKDLEIITSKLAKDPTLISTLSQQAINKSKMFSRERFGKDLLGLIKEL